MKLHPVDRNALERAIEITKTESPARAAADRRKLKNESWRSVADSPPPAASTGRLRPGHGS